MSLVAPAQQSHRRHGKRGLEAERGTENVNYSNSPSAKARRVLSGARSCSPAAFAPYAVGPTTIAALRSLFPAMNEQTISEVLTDCGSDIDAAIKRLGQLQLRAEGRPVASTSTAAAAAAASPRGSPLGGSAVGPASGSGSASAGTAAPDAAAASAAAAQQQQQQQQQQPKTSAEWVEALVQTMSQAKDLDDAHTRAAQALQAFEQAAVSAAQAKAAPEAAQLATLQRDNAILKRAVAIQNGRLQELAGRDAEMAQLRAVAKEYHERVQALELSNYSLAQHLRAATDGRQLGSGQNPHVF